MRTETTYKNFTVKGKLSNGKYSFYLTNGTPVPRVWLGDLLSMCHCWKEEHSLKWIVSYDDVLNSPVMDKVQKREILGVDALQLFLDEAAQCGYKLYSCNQI